MDRLEQYRVFIRVAEMSSFIKAAHSLELPRATVSAAVQQLENSLGVRLLHRTTRNVHLTPDGAHLIIKIRELLTHAEEVEQHFLTQQSQINGRLSVDVPSRLARRLIAPSLPGLMRRYPRLQVFLSSTDRTIDPVKEGIDCVVRVGTLIDSSLAVRPLGKLALVNCASPDYVSEHGQPSSIDDLTDYHVMIGYASPTTGRELPWEYLDEQGRHITLDLPSRVLVNNAENYIACCLAGLGMIQIPRYDVAHLLTSGELVELLPELRPPSMPVSLLYPHRRQRSRKLALFAEWFGQLIEPHLEHTEPGTRI